MILDFHGYIDIEMDVIKKWLRTREDGSDLSETSITNTLSNFIEAKIDLIPSYYQFPWRPDTGQKLRDMMKACSSPIILIYDIKHFLNKGEGGCHTMVLTGLSDQKSFIGNDPLFDNENHEFEWNSFHDAWSIWNNAVVAFIKKSGISRLRRKRIRQIGKETKNWIQENLWGYLNE
jgi:hypothetical protein